MPLGRNLICLEPPPLDKTLVMLGKWLDIVKPQKFTNTNSSKHLSAGEPKFNILASYKVAITFSLFFRQI